jgi:hypothetical protein
MSLGIGTALGIGAGVSGAASIGAAAIGSSAAGAAANTQAGAAEIGAQDQLQLGEENLGLQSQIFNTEQSNEKPFLEAGQNAITRINSLMGQNPLSSAPAASTPPISPPSLSGVSTTIPGAPSVAPIARARGGPVVPFYMQAATRYKVGEKGPEELDMYPNGTGVVIPHDQLLKRGRYASLIPRAMGGPVGSESPAPQQPWNQPGWGAPAPVTGPISGGPSTLPPNLYGKTDPGGPPVGTQPNQPLPAPANGSAPGAPPGASMGNPWGSDPNATADQNNPLVSGGSATPTQNVPFSAWTQQFTAPTAAQAAATPGYQFALQQGENAITDNASALGTTGSGATGAALDQYANNMASTNYQQVYNNALQQYDQNYNIFSNNQANQWNRLASTAGIGQTSAGQLTSAGGNFGNTSSTALMNAGNSINNSLNNEGAALGSGYVGSANAWGGALGNIGNSAMMPLYMQMLNQQGIPGAPATTGDPSVDFPGYGTY